MGISQGYFYPPLNISFPVHPQKGRYYGVFQYCFPAKALKYRFQCFVHLCRIQTARNIISPPSYVRGSFSPFPTPASFSTIVSIVGIVQEEYFCFKWGYLNCRYHRCRRVCASLSAYKENKMNRIFGFSLAVLTLCFLPLSDSSVYAGFCGVGACDPAPQCSDYVEHCKTITRFCRKVVYQDQQMTCYKTVYEKIPTAHKVTYCKYVPETRTKEVHYMAYKPVWETKVKTVTYNVCKPVWETKTKYVPYTVYKPQYEEKVRTWTEYKPVYETKTKHVAYTVCKPQWETRQHVYTVNKVVSEICQKTVPYTVCKAVPEKKTRTWTEYKTEFETRTKHVAYTVCKPQWEVKQRKYTVYRPVCSIQTKEVAYTVCKPVPYQKTIQINCGRWERQCYQVPGPVVYKKVAVADPCAAACSDTGNGGGAATYTPCKCKLVKVQCPPVTCYRKVWIPEVKEKVINCVKYVPQRCTKTVHYSTTKLEPEVRVQHYKVCKMVPEKQIKTVTYQVCKKVPVTRSCTYTVVRYVPEKRLKTVSYRVCKVVPERKVCTYRVCKMVPEKHVKAVQYQVCKMVPVQKSCKYRVCKMVPEKQVKKVCYQVCREVVEQQTKQVQYRTCRLVAEPRVRHCEYTVLKPVVCEKIVQGYRIEAKKVPYTVTRKVPKIVFCKVPVQVYASRCSCCQAE